MSYNPNRPMQQRLDAAMNADSAMTPDADYRVVKIGSGRGETFSVVVIRSGEVAARGFSTRADANLWIRRVVGA